MTHFNDFAQTTKYKYIGIEDRLRVVCSDDFRNDNQLYIFHQFERILSKLLLHISVRKRFTTILLSKHI